MPECTLREIRFRYMAPQRPRVFVIARQGDAMPKVGDKILGWTEITGALVPGSIRFTNG